MTYSCLENFLLIETIYLIYSRRPTSTSTDSMATKRVEKSSKSNVDEATQRTPTQNNTGQSCVSPRTPDSLPSPSVAVTTSPSVAPSIRFTDSVLSYRSSATALSRTKSAITPTRKLDHLASKSDNAGKILSFNI